MNLGNIANKIFQVLENRRGYGGLQDLFQAFHPDQNNPFHNQRFIPYYQYSSPTNVPINWRNSWTLNGISHSYIRNILQQRHNISFSLTADLDSVIGEAIFNRLSTRVSNPAPYEHQAEAIAVALYALDQLRVNLRNGRLPRGLQLPYDVVALLAPTAQGKTEFLETVTLQLVLDAKRVQRFDSTKIICIYSMKAFMMDHFRRFIRDILFINQNLPGNLRPITIGILDGDTPDTVRSQNEIINRLTELIGSRNCPICGSAITQITNRNNIRCLQGHNFAIIRLDRESIKQMPPDILFITPDMLNLILMLPHYRRLFVSGGSPLAVVIDEPHTYIGVFGSNVSSLIRELIHLIETTGGIRPIILASSATVPYPEEFLSKLFISNRNRIKIIQPTGSSQQITTNKGIIAFLPNSGYKYVNAIIEIPVVIASVLDPRDRRILVFVDSVEEAESLCYRIRDNISRPDGFPRDYCNQNTIRLFANDVFLQRDCNRYNNRFARVAAIHARLNEEDRRRIIDDFNNGRINILISTSTLEVGVDLNNVNVVVLGSLPPTPVSFEQRIGRAGRGGTDALIVVVGNENRGVDTFYLTDFNRFQAYLQARRTYRLPLNPANPYIIRSRIGNFTLMYNKILRRLNYNNILNYYVDLAINTPLANLQHLSHITQFLQRYGNSLMNDIRSILSIILRNLQGTQLPRAHNTSAWMRIANQAFGVIGHNICLPIINIRQSGGNIIIRYKRYIDKPESAKFVMQTYSISNIDVNNPNNTYIYPTRSLRGTVHIRSVRDQQIMFEVCGGSFIPLMNSPLINQVSFQTIINEFQRFRDIVSSMWHSARSFYSSNIRPIYINNVRKLLETLDNFIQSVQSIRQVSITHMRAIPLYIPDGLSLEPLLPSNVLNVRNRQLPFVNAIRRRLQNFLNQHELLQYFEYNGRFFNKIDRINIPANLQVVSYQYSFSNLDLILTLSNGQTISYRSQRGSSVEVFNDISTSAVSFHLRIPTNMETTRRSSSSLLLISHIENGLVFLVNYGYKILRYCPNHNRRHSYLKRIGTVSDPKLLVYPYNTNMIELEIDWSKVHLRSQDIAELYTQIIGQRRFNVTDAIEDFKIAVTHSLSHAILNYHSLYTGGNTWDLNEYLEFDRDNNGRIYSSRIILIESDEGGNGISELVASYLPEIVWDSFQVIRQRYQQNPTELAEYGDLLMGKWPVCCYHNILLSRPALVKFFEILTGKPYQSITSSDINSVVPRL